MNPNTALAVLPPSNAAAQTSAPRGAERAEGPRDKAFSSALEKELAPRPVAQAAAAEPSSANRMSAAQGADTATESGKPLPEGGKQPPQAAAPAGAGIGGQDGAAEPVTAATAGQVLQPGVAGSLEPGEAPGDGGPESLATPPDEAEDVLDAAVSDAPSGDEADPGEVAEPVLADGGEMPLFDFFTRALEIPGMATPGTPGATAAPSLSPGPASDTAEGRFSTSAPGAAGSDGDASAHSDPLARPAPSLEAARGAEGGAARGEGDAMSAPLDAATLAASAEGEADGAGAEAAPEAPLAAAVPSATPQPGVASMAWPQWQDLTRSHLNAATASGHVDGEGAGHAGVLSAAVGSSEWLEQIGSGLRWQVGEGISEARLRLNPAELGTLDVQVRVTERGAEVHFVAPHAHAREALEQGMQRLRESLDAQGLQLADASVSDGRAGQGGREQPAPVLPAWSGGPWTAEEDAAPGDALLGARLQGRGLIDLYA